MASSKNILSAGTGKNSLEHVLKTERYLRQRAEQKLLERETEIRHLYAARDGVIQLEKALDTSTRNLHFFIKHVPAAIAMFDREMRYIMASQRWLEEYRLSMDNLTGRSGYTDFPHVPRDWDQIYKRVLSGEVQKGEDDYLVLPDGSGEWVHWEIHPWYTGEGAVGGIIIMTEFITDQKLTAQKMEKMIHDLQVSNAALEKFAYICSHDLKEPLRTISSFVQLIKENKSNILDEQSEDYLNFIAMGAERMTNLIKDVLTYSKLGGNKVHYRHTNMEEVFNYIHTTLMAVIQEKGAVIQVGKLPEIYADRTMMAQLLQNLIANALKFSRPGMAPVINLTAEEQKDKWLFAVSDNGIGIKSEYYEKIFSIFQRLHSRNQYSGTGIGLAICKKIVKEHGGEIWLESVVGEGTTFYFTVPKQKAEEH